MQLYTTRQPPNGRHCVLPCTSRRQSGRGPDDRRCRTLVRVRPGHGRRRFLRRAAQPNRLAIGSWSRRADRWRCRGFSPVGGPPPRGTGFDPGADVSFPTDPYLVPFMTMQHFGSPSDPNAPSRVTPELLKNARLIATPEERSLALERIANGAIASTQLTLAHQTLEEAVKATAAVSIPLVRDQRLIEIVKSLSALSSALLLVGREGLNAAAPVLPEPLAQANTSNRPQAGGAARDPKAPRNRRRTNLPERLAATISNEPRKSCRKWRRTSRTARSERKTSSPRPRPTR